MEQHYNYNPMESHYKAIGWIFAILGGLAVLGSLFSLIFLPFWMRQMQGMSGGQGFPTPFSPGATPFPAGPASAFFSAYMNVMTRILPLLYALAILIGSASVVAGCAVLARKPWARILVIVVAVLMLLRIPIGTVLGAYALWAMLQSGHPLAWERYVGTVPR